MAKYYKTIAIALKTGQNSYVFPEIASMAGALVVSIRTRRTGLTLNAQKIVNPAAFNAAFLSLKSKGTEYFEDMPLATIDIETANSHNGKGFPVNLTPLDFAASKIFIQDAALIGEKEAVELTFEFEK
jgi:hypothetical protein